jgi:hypothetical protein
MGLSKTEAIDSLPSKRKDIKCFPIFPKMIGAEEMRGADTF